MKDGYLDEAGMLTRIAHPACGAVATPAIPIRLSANPGAVRLPPPTLGQHTDAFLGARGGVHRPRAPAPRPTRTRSRTR